MELLGIEIAPAYLLGIAVWLTAVLLLVFIGVRTRKAIEVGKGDLKAFAESVVSRNEAKLDAIAAKVTPFLERVDLALSKLPDLEAIPGTMVEGFRVVLREETPALLAQVWTEGAPVLRGFMTEEIRPLMNDVLNQGLKVLDERLHPLLSVLPAAGTILSRSGVAARFDKKAGREASEALLTDIMPLEGIRKLIIKNAPPSAMEDPMEMLAWLNKAKATLSSFSPQIGTMIDQAIESRLTGLTGGADASGLVKMLPGMGTGPVREASYMTE